jgi:hypothetical protein
MSTVKANTIEPASGGTVTITGAALTTPALGTPASGTLTNCTGLPGSGVVNTPSGGISATTAQGAINELDSEKASLSGASFTGKVSATHATADDNAVSFSNTSATGYGPFFRGGSSTRYAAIFTDKDGTQLSLLTGAGELIVGTNTSPLSTSKMSVLATSSTNGVAVRAGLDANYLYIGQNSSGTDTFRVVGNGNVTNTNNSYGAISDAKLKRDVTNTGPKLSKVLAMRIVNYYLKADSTNTKLLGMIAQELREISPGLVDEAPDFEDVVIEPSDDDRPAVIERRATGTTTLSIKYSILVPMLIKAMQEMHIDFDQRLRALEAKA